MGNLSMFTNAALRKAATANGLTVFNSPSRYVDDIAMEVASSMSLKDEPTLLSVATPKLAMSLVSRLSTSSKVLRVIEEDRKLIADRLGNDRQHIGSYVNVHCSDTTDLSFNPDLQKELAGFQIADYGDVIDIRKNIRHLSAERPLIRNDSVGYCLADLLINRHESLSARVVLSEILRKLQRSGTFRLLAIVSDEPIDGWHSFWPDIPAIRLYAEREMLQLLQDVGFHGIQLSIPDFRPLATFNGIETRLVVIDAYKGKQGRCLDQGHAVIYKGPWNEVHDDDGHVYKRGERTAVCEKTFHLLLRAPYRGLFVPVTPYQEVSLNDAPDFDCSTPVIRDPRVTKGQIQINSCSTGAAHEAKCC